MADLFLSDSRKVANIEPKVKRRWSGGKGTPGMMMIALGPSDVMVYNLLN